MKFWWVLIALAILGIAFMARSQGQSWPDPKLTPGAILDTRPEIVFATGYDHLHRVWDKKLSTCVKYGITRSMCHLFEDDDLCPVCAGGNNADPANHGLQRCTQWRRIGRVYECVAGDAYDKDQLEKKKCEGARHVYWQYLDHLATYEQAVQALHDVQVYFISYAWRKDMP